MFFLELSCLFDDPVDVGNLISGSSAFSKTSLNIRKFTAHILLKPGLENFEHYFTSLWDECNCLVVWAFFGIAFLWDWSENYLFSCGHCGHCWVFQILILLLGPNLHYLPLFCSILSNAFVNHLFINYLLSTRSSTSLRMLVILRYVIVKVLEEGEGGRKKERGKEWEKNEKEEKVS